MHVDEKKRFDKRSVDQRIREGLISQKEYENYLKGLPDVSDKRDLAEKTVEKPEKKKKTKPY
jgi:hypothetical protein